MYKNGLLWLACVHFLFILGACSLSGQTIDPAGSSTNWLAVIYPPGIQTDYFTDQQTGSKESDVVGDDFNPGFLTQFATLGGANAVTGLLGFRLRLAEEKNPAGFSGAAMFGLDATGDGILDVFAGVDNSGSSDSIGLWAAGTDLNISPSTTSIANSPFTNYTETITNYSWTPVTSAINPSGTNDIDGGGNDFFLSFVVPFEDLIALLNQQGITNFNASSPLRYVAITASQDNSFNQDINGLDGGIGSSINYTNSGAISLPTTPSGIPPNSSPLDINLDVATVLENQPSTTLVGTFSTSDPDISDTHTYSLISGTGDTGNASFTISSNQLKAATSFNFEATNSYSIRVRVTDAGGLFYEEIFTIAVLNLNEAPTDFALSSTNVLENQPIGTLVGNLGSIIDPDLLDTHTFSLVPGTGDTGNASFNISSNRLETATSFNREAQDSYSIRIRVTDAGGLSYEEVVTIPIGNVNEAPTDFALSSTNRFRLEQH
jgi:hypothetical protein